MNSFRPGMAQMPVARPVPQQSTYAPSTVSHVPSSSSPAIYNSGSASSGTIKQWGQQQDFLDMYMVNAFYLGTGQRSQYFMSFWKTATCFGLQFIGILLLMEDQWAAYQESSGSCSGTINGNVAIVGYFFATYITIFCTEQIKSLHLYGMYVILMRICE